MSDLERALAGGRIVRSHPAMLTTGSVEEVIAALDKLLELRSKRAKARIDAGACGTPQDFRALEKAEGEYEDGYEAFVERLKKLDRRSR